MTRPELRKLDKIIASIEKLEQSIDDRVSAAQLADAGRALLRLYNAAKADCAATERA